MTAPPFGHPTFKGGQQIGKNINEEALLLSKEENEFRWNRKKEVVFLLLNLNFTPTIESMTHPIQINDQNFVLHSTGALFWKEERMLLISDVHLGKVSHFRKYGAAVPQQAIEKNFELLTEIVSVFEPRTICFLGDLFHSSLNSEWHRFESWISEQTSKIILVAGNHDIISPLKYEDIGILVIQELVLPPFLMTHHPEERNGYFNFSGHIHPAIKLKGMGRQLLKLPCFFKKQQQMVLPAFGEFTGTHILTPTKEDEVYAITKNEVILVAKK
ncbi:ligase-associated DNA damage response endonuclease PdeM [Sediminicola sp. 1XM1-17]|uniref:ligase-associated DNA damage response endonuclease PdeM n=1 Tax=Sediminicola sp. 1XM1-17 TaxID=3127702 RepID=UPI003076FCF5